MAQPFINQKKTIAVSLENTAILDIAWPDGSENMGGMAAYFYYAPRSSFAKNGIPNVPESPASLDDAAVIDCAQESVGYNFKTGKGWNKMYITRDTSGVVCEPQGELDGKSFLNKFSFVHPGNKRRALGFARYANNTPMILLVPESDGTLRQLGSENLPVNFDNITPTTGATTAERKQISFECSYPSTSPAPIVLGYDPLDDAASLSTSSSTTA